MKLRATTLGLALATILASCGGSDRTPAHDLKPGELIGKEQMPLAEGLEKDLVFRVTVKADSMIENGVYSVDAIYGHDTATGKFTMPKELEHYSLQVRKVDSLPHAYVVGFMLPKDTTFYDYFQITGTHNTIQFGYTKAYSF